MERAMRLEGAIPLQPAATWRSFGGHAKLQQLRLLPDSRSQVGRGSFGRRDAVSPQPNARGTLVVGASGCCTAGVLVTASRRQRRWQFQPNLLAKRASAGPTASTVRLATSPASVSGTPRRALRIGSVDHRLLHWVEEHLRASAEAHCEFGSIYLDWLSRKEPCIRESTPLKQGFKSLQLGRLDSLVCAMKDVPLQLPQGLVVAAVLPREEVREAILVRPGLEHCTSLADLPPGSTVSAPSARRAVQIRARYPRLEVDERALVLQERLRLAHGGNFDACVASAAGLARWGFSRGDGLRVLDESELMPAFCQGAIGLLCWSENNAAVGFLAEEDDPETRTCIDVERTLQGSLELLGGAVAGGRAEVQPDGQLHLRCCVTFPAEEKATGAMLAFDKECLQSQFPEVVHEIAEEVAAQCIHHLKSGTHGRPKNHTVQTEAAVDDEGQDEPRLPAKGGAPERIPLSEVDSTGSTKYAGRICGIFPHGVLVDFGYEVPGQWYPETDGDKLRYGWPSNHPLGDEVEVYCVMRQQQHLRVVLEPPPQLTRRGVGERMRLSDLPPGSGPFKAVVISVTQAGILVDFNCETAGQLPTGGHQKRGQELRVYCHEVDAELGTCVVGEERRKTSRARMKLEELIVSNSYPYKGTVQDMTSYGAFVDFNCEVPGLVGPMDIDIDAWPDGLATGHEVTVYVTSLDVFNRRVRLSMYPAS